MRFSFIAASLVLLPATAFAQVYVHGYTKSNGTYVAPHYRSNPDGNPYNNYSTRGNVNPYTGQVGTKTPYSSYGQSSYGSHSNPYSNSSSSGSSSAKTCLYYSPC